MTIASNTKECFTTFIGQKLTGVLHDGGTRTLVFEDGRGLFVSKSGSFWVLHPEAVREEVERKVLELTKAQEDLRLVVELAGEFDAVEEEDGE